MKFGTYYAYWEKQWDADYVKYVKKAAKLGFDVLEVAMGGLVEKSDQELKDLKQAAVDNGIRLTGGIGLPIQYNRASEDENVRKRGYDYLIRIFNAMDKADIRKIGGNYYSYWPADYSQLVNKPKAWELAVKGIQEISGPAADRGITLMMEVLNRFEQYLLNSAQEGLDFVKEVDRENVKVMLDCFHMNIEEDNIADAIRLTKGYLGHFHIGENNRKVPGKGSMPWDEMGKALRDIGYDGDVVMEPFVMMGGQVGSDIKVWRDLSGGADEAKLDRDIEESLLFVRKKFLSV